MVARKRGNRKKKNDWHQVKSIHTKQEEQVKTPNKFKEFLFCSKYKRITKIDVFSSIFISIKIKFCF